jgi:glycyl-tRNA synthetase beta chain
MSTDILLVELRTEELPPKSLAKLAEAFRHNLSTDLQQQGFLSPESQSRAYATPRRLAVEISAVVSHSPDKTLEVLGPSLKVGRDATGQATPALLGFAKKNGMRVEQLSEIDTPKGRVFVCRKTVSGSALAQSLASSVEAALKRLPVAKMMRWGSGDAEFVRPVHGLILLHGSSLITGQVLGIDASHQTCGHRFMGSARLNINNATEYATRLATEGMVMVDIAERRALIDHLLQAAASTHHATLGALADYNRLLDEVTALVEYPAVYTGAFDSEFLSVPAECLILTMRQNQKYFPLFDLSGQLTHRFLIVSNMQVSDPKHIIGGNQRVVRPRLEDARFFYEQDRKHSLASRLSGLDKVIYHNQLGSQGLRSTQISQLAGHIARALTPSDPAAIAAAERAGLLAKTDLVTDMVGEFPELQGIMGRYYATHDGEPLAVAEAIAAHYLPRFAGDQLPTGVVACAAALADKLNALAGLLSIGQKPTGDRDPFALRRHALGVIRILIERDLALPLDDLLSWAFAPFAQTQTNPQANTDLATFIYERLRGYCSDAGYTAQEIEAVLTLRPVRIQHIPRQLQAVRAFAALPAASALAAANKRVANILHDQTPATHVNAELLQEPAEQALYAALTQAISAAEPLYAATDYTAYLQTFAALREPVDAFFNAVMVNADDPQLRHNRLALLGQLQIAMNRIADLAKLAT